MDNIEEKYFLTRGKVILFAFLLIVIFIVLFTIKGCGNSSVNEYKSFEKGNDNFICTSILLAFINLDLKTKNMMDDYSSIYIYI